MQNVFALQDEVARTIADILPTHVQEAEAERALLKPDVASHYVRACVALGVPGRPIGEDLFEARRNIGQSLAIDRKNIAAPRRVGGPNYLRGHIWLATPIHSREPSEAQGKTLKVLRSAPGPLGTSSRQTSGDRCGIGARAWR